MTEPQAREFRLPGGLCLAAQVWHKPDRPLYLALHGWLDNSASFARLAPLLDATVVALDLAGHGHSDHRTALSPYHIWDDIRDLLQVMELLGEQRLGLIGHSRGAIIAALMAASLPERVSRLLLIDGLAPEPVSADEAPTQLRRALLELPRHANRRFPVYPSVQAAAKVRLEGPFPLSEAAALTIAERGTRPVPGGVSWRVDPKLLAPSFLKLTSEQIAAFLRAITAPATLVLAEQGIPKLFPRFYETLHEFTHIEQLCLPGSHHLHLESQAEQLAAIFNARLAAP